MLYIEAAEKEANAQGGSTWTGWAVNSLASRFYQPSANDQQNTNNKPPTTNNKGSTSSTKKPEPSKISGMKLMR